MARKSKTDLRARLANLKRGIEKHWPDPPMMGSKKHTKAELVAFFQKLIDSFDAVDQARMRYEAALANRAEAERDGAPLVNDVLGMADAYCGKDVQKRGDFGLPPRRKKGPKTPMAKLLMVTKARATRKKRGTMGKRQRKKIRGW